MNIQAQNLVRLDRILDQANLKRFLEETARFYASRILVLDRDLRPVVALNGPEPESPDALPLERDGEAWDLDMPALPLGDDDLAALLTYVRREWGHGADPVEPATVASERAATLGREDPWTVAELEAMFDR